MSVLRSLGAFQVLQLVQESGLKADCKLYTTLISTCAKSGKVDSMFEVCIFLVVYKLQLRFPLEFFTSFGNFSSVPIDVLLSPRINLLCCPR